MRSRADYGTELLAHGSGAGTSASPSIPVSEPGGATGHLAISFSIPVSVLRPSMPAVMVSLRSEIDLVAARRNWDASNLV